MATNLKWVQACSRKDYAKQGPAQNASERDGQRQDLARDSRSYLWIEQLRNSTQWPPPHNATGIGQKEGRRGANAHECVQEQGNEMTRETSSGLEDRVERDADRGGQAPRQRVRRALLVRALREGRAPQVPGAAPPRPPHGPRLPDVRLAATLGRASPSGTCGARSRRRGRRGSAPCSARRCASRLRRSCRSGRGGWASST
jgi:hypothetical protein